MPLLMDSLMFADTSWMTCALLDERVVMEPDIPIHYPISNTCSVVSPALLNSNRLLCAPLDMIRFTKAD